MEKTPKYIALVLLWAFVYAVLILFTVNIFITKLSISDFSDLRTGWFDMLRNAMVLLSTALTTVIGYYFGQKVGAEKEARANEAIDKAKISVQKTLSDAAEDFKISAMNSGAVGSDSIEPNSPPIDESNSDIQIP